MYLFERSIYVLRWEGGTVEPLILSDLAPFYGLLFLL